MRMRTSQLHKAGAVQRRVSVAGKMKRVQLRVLLSVALATVVVLDADAYIAEEQFIPAGI